MDATSASGGNGFDAALRALEDLETSVAQVRDDQPPAAPAVPAAVAAPEPVLQPTGALAFSDGEPDDAPVAIAAVPVAEAEPLPAPVPAAAPAADPEPGQPQPAPAAAAVVAAPAPAAVPAAVPAAPGRWTKVAIGLGLLSSVVSAAGLIIAERTIMSAQLVVATARERQEQLEQATKLIRDLQLVRDRQIELLKAQQAQLASTPVTSAELQHRMDALQEGIMKRDPVNQMVEVVRAGQSDDAGRFGELGMKIDRLEASLERR